VIEVQGAFSQQNLFRCRQSWQKQANFNDLFEAII